MANASLKTQVVMDAMMLSASDSQRKVAIDDQELSG